MTQNVSGFPISMPSSEPVQRAARVHSVAVTLAGMPRRDPTVPLREIGTLRFQLLEALGLADTERLAGRIERLTTQDLDDLAYGVLDLAKASLDRLLEQATASTPPVILCAEKDDPTELIGRTLLWADHYLVPDELADALLQSQIRLDAVEDCLQQLLALRPLIELGVVVPVPEDLATVLSARATYEATETDLQSEDLVKWINGQLLVEGPTAREALIIGAQDDLSLGGDIIYFHAHVDPDSFDDATRTFQTRLLTPYQPDFDYGPWVAQSRRQAVAQLLQDANRSLAVAEAFGGHAVTRSPFRARLLRHKETQQHPASSLVWADIPWLPGASAPDLAKVASEDESVEALRAHTRRAFRRTREEGFSVVAEDLAAELREAVRQLENQMQTTRTWGLVRPTPFLALTVGLGATTGPVGAIAAVAGAVASVLPTIGQLREQRQRPAYALVMAKRRQTGG